MKNLEVFKSTYTSWELDAETEISLNCDTPPAGARDAEEGEGWFFWFCLPGCLPDSEPFGPFDNKKRAMEYAEEMFGEDE